MNALPSPSATSSRMTAVQWLICIIAAIGFAFDSYELLMAPLFVGPSLVSLLGVPATTGNARRLAHTMRSLGFVGIKSRRLMPGGFRDTTIRGWARPFRERRCSNSTTGAAARVCEPKR